MHKIDWKYSKKMRTFGLNSNCSFSALPFLSISLSQKTQKKVYHLRLLATILSLHIN